MKKKDFKDCEGLLIRYKSNMTVKDNGTIWTGLIRKVDPNDDGEVEINGCMHQVSTIEVMEVLDCDNGIVKMKGE